MDKQEFDPSACGSVADEARGNDLGVVEDEEVAEIEIVGDVAELPVRQRAGGAIEDEESRLIAPRRGVLGDQLGREIIVEVGEKQGGGSGAKYEVP
jgi:hypothetical protein